jgi:ubiquinone/menaquinone biosynthesis C-methylase UbiE
MVDRAIVGGDLGKTETRTSQPIFCQLFYYSDGKVSDKRTRTAVQTFNHISTISGGMQFRKIIDIGVGDGAVLAELAKRGFGEEYAAVEISSSGIEAIQNRGIEAIKSVEGFDGYKILHEDQAFDLGLAIHVLEHVKHERLFLREAARDCKQIYAEIPLEHNQSSLKSHKDFGQIRTHTFLYVRDFFQIFCKPPDCGTIG